MTTPSAPIDADLGEWDNKSYFVIEEDLISRKFLKTVGAVWENLYNPATQFTGGTFENFLRIRCAPGTPIPIVYAMGIGGNDESGDHQPFMLRTENNGLTWSQHWIEEALTVRPYTVTHVTQQYAYPGGNTEVDQYHGRVGDDGSTVNPWAAAILTTINDGTDHGIWGGINGISTSLYTGSGSNLNPWIPPRIYGWSNSLLSAGDGATAHSWILEYLGAYENKSVLNMPKESARVNFRHIFTHGSACALTVQSWVFWNKPSIIVPKALDVVRANPNVLFVGLQDKILYSVNGGFDWTDYVATHGAYDICADPTGYPYYWDTDGNLRCAVAGVPQAPLLTGEIYGESKGAFRIALDWGTGKIWAIHNSDLKLYNLASWSTQKTGILNGCGLRAFYASPTKLAFLDGSDIYLSLDAGATWANKKGSWSTFALPRTIHLLEAP